MDKSLFRKVIYRRMVEQMSGIPYSRHRSNRIRKKLLKRATVKTMIWLDEYASVQRMAEELKMITGIPKNHFPDAVDAIVFAFDRTLAGKRIIMESKK